ncbi:RNA 2'-phosphotransferase [Thalassomonas actiniarum]|uniref:Probable RNA 2'-phosphotransferase n=1 Tax=Thalassomonas actiniarum TaxID=485447 RepID=A0AAE9YND1_9GAMM|nr:RNA 2'-phosphotransferase [Thalassomonas actiniarum]WDD98269.1 RNA 2'-phosphotransferase [Thalassomonas actiniarum]
MSKQLTKTSKFLSLILRHKPETINLTLDDHGWADINEIIIKAAAQTELALSKALIHEIVANNDKQRFALSADGLRIRANQGHSLEVDLGLTAQTAPEILYHGTASRFLASIAKTGLVAGERQYVHLSENINTARQVGQRYGKAVILTLDTRAMAAQGHQFYQAKNGVWLTPAVPPEFINIPE